tara:strand:- start:662 stop:826 length:165 start_codon:yes stop_codon:yes gene_type:complete
MNEKNNKHRAPNGKKFVPEPPGENGNEKVARLNNILERVNIIESKLDFLLSKLK